MTISLFLVHASCIRHKTCNMILFLLFYCLFYVLLDLFIYDVQHMYVKCS